MEDLKNDLKWYIIITKNLDKPERLYDRDVVKGKSLFNAYRNAINRVSKFNMKHNLNRKIVKVEYVEHLNEK